MPALQRQALCHHLPGLQPLLEAMPATKSRSQQARCAALNLRCCSTSRAGWRCIGAQQQYASTADLSAQHNLLMQLSRHPAAALPLEPGCLLTDSMRMRPCRLLSQMLRGAGISEPPLKVPAFGEIGLESGLAGDTACELSWLPWLGVHGRAAYRGW